MGDGRRGSIIRGDAGSTEGTGDELFGGAGGDNTEGGQGCHVFITELPTTEIQFPARVIILIYAAYHHGMADEGESHLRATTVVNIALLRDQEGPGSTRFNQRRSMWCTR